MAERRMFAKAVIDSDAFMELPKSAQLLYFHLGMRADDDGFVNKPRTIMRMAGCTEEDLQELVGQRYLIAFDSGVMVIRHWKIHNYLRSDRYKPTVYAEEKAGLLEGENGVYVLGIPDGIPLVYQMDTQDRLGKDRLGKDRSGEESEDQERKNKENINQEKIGLCGGPEENDFLPPTPPEVLIYVIQKKYDIDPERFVRFYEKNGWLEGGKPMKDWKKAVDRWQLCK